MPNQCPRKEIIKRPRGEARQGKTAADCSNPILPCAANRAVEAGVVAAARTGVGMSMGKDRVRPE